MHGRWGRGGDGYKCRVAVEAHQRYCNTWAGYVSTTMFLIFAARGSRCEGMRTGGRVANRNRCCKNPSPTARNVTNQRRIENHVYHDVSSSRLSRLGPFPTVYFWELLLGIKYPQSSTFGNGPSRLQKGPRPLRTIGAPPSLLIPANFCVQGQPIRCS